MEKDRKCKKNFYIWEYKEKDVHIDIPKWKKDWDIC